MLDQYKHNHISLIEKIKLPKNFHTLITETSLKIFNKPWLITITSDPNSKLDSIDETEEKDNQQVISLFSESKDFQEIKTLFPEMKIIAVE